MLENAAFIVAGIALGWAGIGLVALVMRFGGEDR